VSTLSEIWKSIRKQLTTQWPAAILAGLAAGVSVPVALLGLITETATEEAKAAAQKLGIATSAQDYADRIPGDASLKAAAKAAGVDLQSEAGAALTLAYVKTILRAEANDVRRATKAAKT
jgi:hypothetical protein